MKRLIYIPFLLFLVASCSGFAYKYYGIIPSQSILLGKSSKEDLPLSSCEPDAHIKGKCIVMFAGEFERMRADMANLNDRLKACEKGK